MFSNRDLWRHSLAALYGAGAALCLAAYHFAQITPSYLQLLIPIGQFPDLAEVTQLAQSLQQGSALLLLALLVFLGGYGYLLATAVNPGLTSGAASAAGRRLLFVRLVAGGSLLVGACVNYAYYILLVPSELSLAMSLLVLVAYALAWVLLLPVPLTGQTVGDGAPWRWRGQNAVRGAVFAILWLLLCHWLLLPVWQTVQLIMFEALRHSLEPDRRELWLQAAAVAGMAALLAVLLFTAAPLLQARREHTGRLLVLGLAVFTGLAAVALPVRPTWFDLDKAGLAAAAGIAVDDVESLTLVQLCGHHHCSDKTDALAGREVLLRSWPARLPADAPATSGVPVAEETAIQLQEFIAGAGRRSIYRRQAIQALAAIYNAMLLPGLEFHVYDDLLRQGQLPYRPLQNAVRHLAWLKNSAPINYITLEDLTQLSDAAQYRFAGQAAADLAAAWHRFGDEDRARALLALAEQTGYHPVLPAGAMDDAGPGVRNGTINGRIVLGDGGAAGARLALLRLSEEELNRRLIAPDAAIDAVLATDSAVLSADGEFSFTNLSEGQYRLVMLVPAATVSAGAVLAGDNIPGMLQLDAENPDLDLGTIGLQLKR